MAENQDQDQDQDKARLNAIRLWAEGWLSAERFAPYLSACDGNPELAVGLYKWNVELGKVLMGDVSHFEVALRNAYDKAMTESWGEGWLTDDTSPARRPVMRSSANGKLDVNRINRKVVDNALKDLPSGHSHGDLVASLTLGFWVHLADRSREAVIWRTGLYRAWPKGTKRKGLQRDLLGILHVRNRVAHSERLFNPRKTELSPKTVDESILRLFESLCPEAYQDLYGGNAGKSSVELFLDSAPAPAEITL